MEGVYLLDHPPVRSQFASRGKVRPTGLTVMHTAESVLDTIGPDTGAENVAAFIQRRTTPGSYHDLADSDTVVQLVRYEDQAYQDGTGSNPYALSISFALRTSDWSTLSREKRRAFLRQGAVAFARQQRWLRAKGYPTTPLRWVSREQSSAGVAGFIRHSQRDPARRTDPGANFPADEWFQECSYAINPVATPWEDTEMIVTCAERGTAGIVSGGGLVDISGDSGARAVLQSYIDSGKALPLPVTAASWDAMVAASTAEHAFHAQYLAGQDNVRRAGPMAEVIVDMRDKLTQLDNLNNKLGELVLVLRTHFGMT